ncbi:MAG TPA: hypothetical protein VFJ74_08280 [Gemmatimonadaceae bacterium]|nr:hypothetical protein [Gemmatimonadaceae bacterium]
MTNTFRVRVAVLGCAHALLFTLLSAPLAAQARARDTTFLLTTHAPDRSPPPLLGNGRIGGTVAANGTAPAPLFVAGLYEEAKGDVPRIAAVPSPNTVDVFDGASWLNAAPPAARERYTQTLDMRTATVRTSYDWVDGERRTSISVESFLSRADPYVAAIRVRVVPHYAGRLRVAFPLLGWPEPKRLPLGTATRYDPSWKAADTWYPGHTTVVTQSAAFTGMVGGEVAVRASPDGRATTHDVALHGVVRWPSALVHPAPDTMTAVDTALLWVTFDAASGHAYVFDKIVGVATSNEGVGVHTTAARAARRARAAALRGYDALRAAHVAAWARRWRTDVEIAGDPALQRVVRSMLYQLLASADSGTALGVPPMGLSGGGYYGHVFWDSDTWMFPALLLTHPDVARSLVDFRAATVDTARKNARANGYAGAMYPWEADERGYETTPRFAAQNASSEIHVNGDVALAAWQYYLATGDSTWLARSGFPVLQATADFWVSRVTLDTAHDVYHIRNVVSVDEGLIGVSDDGYTNAVARRNLETAAAAARRLGLKPNAQWARVAERLHIAFDSTRRTYLTYEGAPDSTLGSVTALLSYPLGMPMEADVKRANLEHAVRRMLGGRRGAMMGGTLLSVVAAELGDRALVDTLLEPSYDGYLKGPFLMISETPTNDAVSFVTGAGGFLQQVIYGWTGLRLGASGVEPAFAPVLPSRVTRMRLRNLTARGRRFDVIVDGKRRRIVDRGVAR